MRHTVIAPDLLTAYRDTAYIVHATPPFSLKVDVPSCQLQQWMQAHACQCAMYITACNPYSQILDDAENAYRQSVLKQWIQQRGVPYENGVGQPLDGAWKPEASFLVGGLPLEQARMLGQRFQQNALIWCGRDTVAQLVLLR